MSGVILFIMVLIASFIVVRVGAIAFHLTGLEWSLAKFQALSCFSGTGFTTREAELVTTNPQRRKVASVLMVLGNAGLVTMIASVATAFNSHQTLWSKFSESILPFSIPSVMAPWINLLVIVVAIYVVYRIFTGRIFARKITDILRSRIEKKKGFRPVTFEDLVLMTGGYGITRFKVCPGSPLLDKVLVESDLRRNDVTVLAIVRGDTTIANPSAETRIVLGDELISFGRLENIRSVICPI